MFMLFMLGHEMMKMKEEKRERMNNKLQLLYHYQLHRVVTTHVLHIACYIT